MDFRKCLVHFRIKLYGLLQQKLTFYVITQNKHFEDISREKGHRLLFPLQYFVIGKNPNFWNLTSYIDDGIKLDAQTLLCSKLGVTHSRILHTPRKHEDLSHLKLTLWEQVCK